MSRTMLLGALMLSLTGWPISAAQAGDDVMVTSLGPGVVCRNSRGERIPGDRPKRPPFRAEATTFDRVRIRQNDGDCYLNPGEYSTAPQPNTAPNSDCPSGQIAAESGKIKGTRSGEDLRWCDE
jgi:hypothetical protein